jgi:hypothetical protein
LLLVVAVTISFAAPSRVDAPSKVTSAFSDVQVRFALLKRAMMVLSERGMEKFAWASEMRREIESPSVTFVRSEEERVVVVQPVALAVVHVAPVNPFVHIQAHDPESIMDVPPFLQAVAGLASHCWRAERVVVDAVFDLWKTRSSRGTTTAAAVIIRRIKRTIMNPQQGKPQQRRFFFGLSESCPTPADGS